MPRAKRSSWEPKGIELWEIDHLYDDAARDELVCIHLGCGSASAEKRGRVLDLTLGAAARLNMDLHYIEQPHASEQRVAIDAVLSSARKLAAALEALDATSLGLLESTADRDDTMNERGGQRPRMPLPVVVNEDTGETVVFRSSLGGDRMRDACRAVDDLARWSNVAMPETALRRKRQNSRPEATRAEKCAAAIGEAVASLEVIWRDAWRRNGSPEPNATPGTLIPFARAALNPVLADRGKALDLRKAVETALYAAPRSSHH